MDVKPVFSCSRDNLTDTFRFPTPRGNFPPIPFLRIALRASNSIDRNLVARRPGVIIIEVKTRTCGKTRERKETPDRIREEEEEEDRGKLNIRTPTTRERNARLV